MRTLFTVLVIILILGGGYYWYQTQSAVPTPTQNNITIDTNTSTPQPSATTTTTTATTTATTTSTTKSFTVTGSNYAFAPKTLTVAKGDTVKITFKNSGGMHDFVIDQFKAKTQRLQSGKEETITFVADKTGTFEYYCSVGNHRQMGMVGTLTVQ